MLKAVMVAAAAGIVGGAVAMSVGGAPAAAQRTRVPECPHTMPGATQTLTCSCMGTGSSGRAWGTDTYTADSEICAAAQHADALDERGVVTVFSAPGRASYRGSVRNDVETSDWGSFTRSITFHPGDRPAREDGYSTPMTSGAAECPHTMPGGTARLTCSCMTSGSSGTAWGTDVYTADSEICLAAQHAGAVAENGDVTVLSAPGRRAYRGSLRNQVRTSAWGSYSRSIVFRRQP